MPIVSLVLLLSALLTLPSLAFAGADPASSLDEEKNIQFTFDNEASIKIAKASSDIPGMSCDEKSEGAIRYNKNIRSIEYCNRDNWVIMGQPSNPDLKISCTQISVQGSPGTYFAKAHCPNDTVRLNGGGHCRLVSSPTRSVSAGHAAAIHDSYPNDNGWTTDCYDGPAGVEAIATAMVECCKITLNGQAVYRQKY